MLDVKEVLKRNIVELSSTNHEGADEIIDKIFTLPEVTKNQLLAPIIRGKKGEYVNLLE